MARDCLVVLKIFMNTILAKDVQAFFLDFDGVVVESADIKTEAFYELYLDYGIVIAEKAKQYHLNNQGINRNVKFYAIHKKYLNIDCTQEISDELSKQFSNLVLQKILNCPIVPGIVEFLYKINRYSIPVFLLSASPHKELEFICNQRNLTKFFSGIYGSPATKEQTGKILTNEYKFSQNKIIFIGDSISDFNASVALGVCFLGRVAKGMENPFILSVPIIENFSNLLL